ncbi:contactin-6 isoform X2 [Aphidius gifuensis]|uniref:contactin-6 isoform X2 n=1 Tax=Aphidius gifuensis TaxID=684658 RepID=UPI001CDCA380|nr:contactin-6 isoform X2 [Aphidius gifuensis]XP_044015127.1 contactin-6 isoform X2 [Aphidius gifuensis]
MIFIENKIILVLVLVLPGWQYKQVYAEKIDEKIKTIEVDIGDNVTVACANDDIVHDSNDNANVMWVREGRNSAQIERMKIGQNKALQLVNVSRDDAGNYFCTLDNDGGSKKWSINIQVKTPPPPLHRVWVKPSTILANLLWEINETGGYPIIDFTAQYRPKHVAENEPNDWLSIIPEHIPPNSRQIDVYHLEPNQTYVFRVWATNRLGAGKAVEVEGHTRITNEEYELAKHLLEGAENFDTRVWIAAVGIVMGTLLILGLGTCCLLYRECKVPFQDVEGRF